MVCGRPAWGEVLSCARLCRARGIAIAKGRRISKSPSTDLFIYGP